jgi:hypothetical protein
LVALAVLAFGPVPFNCGDTLDPEDMPIVLADIEADVATRRS